MQFPLEKSPQIFLCHFFIDAMAMHSIKVLRELLFIQGQPLQTWASGMLDLLIETFQKEAAKGKLRAAGICYEVLTVPPGKDQKQDAICCGLEHCLGEAVDVFTPYVRTGDGNFRYDEIFAAKRTPQFFCNLPRC